MRLFISIVLLVSFVFLASCSTPAPKEARQIENKWMKDKWIGEFVDGWDVMMRFLNDYEGRPKDLMGKKFKLKVKLDGEWQLIVFPVRGYEVKRTGDENLFEAEIIDPSALYEVSGGLSRLTYIQAELKKIGGDKGTINLAPEIDCLFKIKFKQKNGQLVDFNRLLERYEYEFVISPSSNVEVYSVTSEHVTLRKIKNLVEPAFFRLLLVDKKTKETFYSNQVNIPKCGYEAVLTENPDNRKFFMIKDAGQCIRHLRSHGEKIDKTKVHRVYQKEDFYNVCSHPVKCKLTAKYGYVKDKKIVDADTKVYDFLIGPNALKSVNTSWNYLNQQYEFDAKVYIAATVSKSSLPKDFKNEDMPGFLECSFK